jgi:hypothetical protein
MYVLTWFFEKFGNRQGHGNRLGKFDRQDGRNGKPNRVHATNGLVNFFGIHFAQHQTRLASRIVRRRQLFGIALAIPVGINFVIFFTFFNNYERLVRQVLHCQYKGLSSAVFGRLDGSKQGWEHSAKEAKDETVQKEQRILRQLVELLLGCGDGFDSVETQASRSNTLIS